MSQPEQNVVVLVADDEPSTLALVSSHVRSKGYKVFEASDGDQAWQLAHEHLPDLVILDVMMPGMSGWEVCRKIREAVSLAHTGVIMLTGIGENLNEMTSPLYGADAYLDKPFDFAELDSKVVDTLKDRRGGAMGRHDPEPTSVEPPPLMNGRNVVSRATHHGTPKSKSVEATRLVRVKGGKSAPAPAPTKTAAKKSAATKSTTKVVVASAGKASPKAKSPVAKKATPKKVAVKATAKKVSAKPAASVAKKPSAAKAVTAKAKGAASKPGAKNPARAPSKAAQTKPVATKAKANAKAKAKTAAPAAKKASAKKPVPAPAKAAPPKADKSRGPSKKRSRPSSSDVRA